MKKYEITTHIQGCTKSKIIEAKNSEEALEIAWSLGYEDVYVSEIETRSDTE